MRRDSRYSDYAITAALAAGMLSSIVFAKYFPISTITGALSTIVLLVAAALLLRFGRTAKLLPLMALLYFLALSSLVLAVWAKVALSS